MTADTKQKILAAIEEHKKNLANFEAEGIETIEKAAEVIIDCLKNNGRVYICGNGGSAADSQHIAAELLVKLREHRKALPAIALTTDTSILTAVANDYNAEHIFARQVEALVSKKDLLWALSTSGSSPNILKAAKIAKENRAKVLAFTGKTQSELEKIADVCFCSPADFSDRCQEIHQIAYHIICDLVEQNFCKNK